MSDVDVFSVRDLRNNAGQLIKDAENGQLSLITRHGHPMLLAVPFNSQLLDLGVDKSLALHLFEKKIVTLSQAAKIAGLSMDEFLDILKETGIDAVDYPEDDLKSDLENIL
jgi:predicted HTH domain antitoxin